MNSSLIHEFEDSLGTASVLYRPEDLLLYEYDGSVEKGPGACCNCAVAPPSTAPAGKSSTSSNSSTAACKLENGYALPAAMGAAAKRARRLQERRSSVVIQLSAGGGEVAPCLNLPIPPRRPGPPSFTAKSAGTAKSPAAGS